MLQSAGVLFEQWCSSIDGRGCDCERDQEAGLGKVGDSAKASTRCHAPDQQMSETSGRQRTEAPSLSQKSSHFVAPRHERREAQGGSHLRRAEFDRTPLPLAGALVDKSCTGALMTTRSLRLPSLGTEEWQMQVRRLVQRVDYSSSRDTRMMFQHVDQEPTQEAETHNSGNARGETTTRSHASHVLAAFPADRRPCKAMEAPSLTALAGPREAREEPE